MREDEEDVRTTVKLIAVFGTIAIGVFGYGVFWVRDALRAEEELPAAQREVPETSPSDWFATAPPPPRVGTFHEVEGTPHQGAYEPEAFEEEEDPQMIASRQSMESLGDGGMPQFYPTRHTARLVSSEGFESPLAESCEVRVLPVTAYQFNCLVRVMCGGTIIYPDAAQGAGYAPCDAQDGRPVRAHDGMFTGDDGDPTVEIDLLARRVVVTDGVNGEAHSSAVLEIMPDQIIREPLRHM